MEKSGSRNVFELPRATTRVFLGSCIFGLKTMKIEMNCKHSATDPSDYMRGHFKASSFHNIFQHKSISCLIVPLFFILWNSGDTPQGADIVTTSIAFTPRALERQNSTKLGEQEGEFDAKGDRRAWQKA